MRDELVAKIKAVDGALGAAELRRAGGIVVAQSAESCVVYGMPRAVVERGIAVGTGTPAQISPWIAGLAPGGRWSGGIEAGTRGKVA